MNATLSESQVAALARLGGVLIPDYKDIRGARTLLADGTWLQRAFSAAPHLHRAVLAALADEGGDAQAAVERWRAASSGWLDAVGHLVAGAYFMVPEVRRGLGYPGQVKNPAKLEEAIDDLDGDILDPVMDRGPIFRPTPTSGI